MLPGALDVIGPTSFCVAGEAEAGRWPGFVLGHRVSRRTGHQKNIHFSTLFLWGFLLLLLGLPGGGRT